jgi:hypothetical protein
MKVLRPIYNILAPFLHRHKLTKAGEVIPLIYTGIIAVQNNDHEIFGALLKKVYNDILDPDISCLLVGLHEKDSLNMVLKDFSHIKLKTKLYVATWQDGEDFFKQLDARVPYLELGSL